MIDALIVILLIIIIFFLFYRTFNKSENNDAIEIQKKNLEIDNLKHKLENQNNNEERLKTVFQNLSNEILKKNSKEFKQQNAEQIENILKPVQEKFKELKEKIQKNNDDFIENNSSLKTYLESVKTLNEKLSMDTKNLTNALVGDNKVQGDWGEHRLEVLLEHCGLVNNIHYTSQGGYEDSDGNLKKPDFIINLPDNKHIIIDSKVSLKDYYDYSTNEDISQKKLSLKKHVKSIRNHFDELSKKNYHSLYGINSPESVLMFMPIEPALMLAYQEDTNLHIDAYQKNVVLMSTSVLLATLSTISSLWKQEDQKKNAMEIAEKGGALYDKFKGFVDDLIDVGKSLEKSTNSYKTAMNKLTEGRGNLVSRAQRLKELGVKSTKNLPQNVIDRSIQD
jgi:DNA recombination protein RmuC